MLAGNHNLNQNVSMNMEFLAGKMLRAIGQILLIFFVSGCATQSSGLYYWGSYETSLNDRYVTNDMGQAVEQLNQTITAAEQQNKRVPPGLYADYGFLVFKQGNKAAAITYFEKERSLYPESVALMNKLIDRVKGINTANTQTEQVTPNPGSEDKK
jgi:hypothetical protein